MIKNVTLGIILSVFGLATANNVSAQAFEKGGFYLSAGIVGSSPYNIYAGGVKPGYGTPARWFAPAMGGIHVQGEWGIHKYVGLGFVAGVQGGTYGWWPIGWGGGARPYGVLSIPVGVVANFHFYQLIADKTGKNIHADKLDIYAGINTGSGMSFVPTPGWVNALFFVGPHAGIRYYFAPNIAVNGEFGYGKSFASAGFTFKL